MALSSTKQTTSMSTQAYHDPTFLREVWALFGIGCAIMAVRFIVRIRAVGVRRFEGDDWMAIAVFLCYTCDAVTVELCYKWGTNVDFTPEQLEAFTDKQQQKIELGSKMQLLAWFTYTALVWGLKAQMLFFYNRLTFGLRQQFFVKVMGVAVAVTYMAVFLTIMLGCYPTQKNWQVVPYPGLKCTFKMQNFYVSTVLNVLTDAAVLAIPLPLLWTLRVPTRQKIALVLMLCSGMFVISAAIIRITMTLVGNPSALNINRWGVRETIAGIVAVNVPIIRPVFTKAFWSRNFPPGSRKNKGSTPHSHSRSAARPRHSKFDKLHAYELDDDVQAAIDYRHAPDSASGKKYSQQTTVVELDSASTSDIHPHLTNRSSEDLVIQKPGDSHGHNHQDRTRDHNRLRNVSRQASKSISYHEEDIEAAHPPMEVSIEQRYEIGPSSTGPLDSPRDSEPRPWSAGWPGAGYGNRTTIAADHGLGLEER